MRNLVKTDILIYYKLQYYHIKANINNVLHKKNLFKISIFSYRIFIYFFYSTCQNFYFYPYCMFNACIQIKYFLGSAYLNLLLNQATLLRYHKKYDGYKNCSFMKRLTWPFFFLIQTKWFSDLTTRTKNKSHDKLLSQRKSNE